MSTKMFSSIEKILSAYDAGRLTNYGLEVALDSYTSYDKDAEWSIETGEMFQQPQHSER